MRLLATLLWILASSPTTHGQIVKYYDTLADMLASDRSDPNFAAIVHGTSASTWSEWRWVVGDATATNATTIMASTHPNNFVGRWFKKTPDLSVIGTGGVAASNIVSGGQIPIGTLAPTNAATGQVLGFDGTERIWETLGMGLTNVGNTNVSAALSAGTNIVFSTNGTTISINTPSATSESITNLSGTAPISVSGSNIFLSSNIAVTNLGLAAINVTNRAAMEALTGLTDGTPVILKGYYVQGDSPSVIYTYVAGDTSAVDNGSVITNAAGRFKINLTGNRVDPRNFGYIVDWIETGGSWTNGSTNIVLSSEPTLNYVGKKIAVRRGSTAVGATVTLQASDLSAGVITSFTVVSNGQGYINVPTNVLVSGPGSGATTTVVLTNGRVASITVGAGGTLYTTNSIFKIRSSTDVGTTNAPFFTELLTVLSQSSSNLTVTPAPTFTANLNIYDDPSQAMLYTDNAIALQAAVDYAYVRGAETYIPAGDAATGPVYLNPGQKIVGGGQDLARIHSAALLGFSPFRKSVFTPKNVNTVNGRHLTASRMYGNEICGFTIDGSGPYQNPLGPNLVNGSFASFGINCVAVEDWHIHNMTISNCQGGAIYYGSFAPPSNAAADYPLVQSLYITTEKCRFEGNWRQVHQLGNSAKVTESDCQLLDSSRGYYETQLARNILQGGFVGQNQVYSAEQIDAEANGTGVSGYFRWLACWMQNKYGSAINIFGDQQHMDFVNCTIKDCYSGGIQSSPASGGSLLANNQDSLGEWLTIENCRFICTATNLNTIGHLGIRFKGVRIINNIFSGKTANTDIVIDSTGFIAAPDYQVSGITFMGNTVNLYPTDGSTNSGQLNWVNAAGNYKDTILRNNNIISATMGINQITDGEIVSYEKMSGVNAQEGYTWQTATPSANFKSEPSSAGLGNTDFTVFIKYAHNRLLAGGNGKLWSWITSAQEMNVYDKVSSAGSVIQMDWAPNGVGSRLINIPPSAIRNAYPAFNQDQRPINLFITRTRGALYKVIVTSGGTGYTNAPTVTFGGGAAAATAQIDATSGTVTNIYITARGSGYSTNPIVTLTGGTAGTPATADASCGKLEFYFDDTLAWTDYGTNNIVTMSTTAGNASFSPNGGTEKTYLYAYGMWNRAMVESDMRRTMLWGPHENDKWGVFNSTVGCLTYVKMNSGIGWFFEDLSANRMNVWGGAALTHGIPKRSGQILKRITTAGASTNSVNVSSAAGSAIPANALITSIYAVGQSLGVPSVVVGFDAALANPITTAKTLVAGVTNYLPLVQAYIYGSTNRPVYISTSGASTNDYVINYTLDQGELSGPFLGFQDASSAAAGDIGETLTSAVAVTGAFNLATTVVTNVTSLSLTPGRWIVYGNANFTGTNSTITAMSAGITTTTATIPTDGTEQNSWVALTTTSFKHSIGVKPKTFTVSTTTPVYLVMVGTFSTANSVGGYGSMIAQRQ